jgi:SAM-dependent methyltransferase
MATPRRSDARRRWLASSELAERGVELARDLRTVVLWLLGPADTLQRRLLGRPALPPLWLRRHTGPAHDFERAADDMETMLVGLGLVRTGDRVLEIGCGCGAMVPALARLLGHDGCYLGFDVHRPSIRWCRRRFAGDGRLRFEWADLASPYGNGASARPVEAYRFPVADGDADFVLAKSVFTHLRAEQARHYLGEIRRTLRPGGRALVTAFLFDRRARPPAFPFPDSDSPLRWRRRLRVEAAVAFERAHFESLVEDAGLAVGEAIYGYWPGETSPPRGQDVLILA